MATEREAEYLSRVELVLVEFEDVSGPKQANYLMMTALAIIDGYCFGHMERRASEKEFLDIARAVYRQSRKSRPLVKPRLDG